MNHKSYKALRSSVSAETTADVAACICGHLPTCGSLPVDETTGSVAASMRGHLSNCGPLLVAETTGSVAASMCVVTLPTVATPCS